MVYHDCRDVSFDDIGFSPRMTEAILNEAGNGIGQRLERLSDILSWLLRRGFKMELCVDRKQAMESGVEEFIERLRRTSNPNLTIFTKEVDGGAMHKKALVTPVGVLKGSANLTQSGTGRNEEIIDHVFYGTISYVSLKANVDDTFHGADRLGT